MSEVQLIAGLRMQCTVFIEIAHFEPILNVFEIEKP